MHLLQNLEPLCNEAGGVHRAVVLVDAHDGHGAPVKDCAGQRDAAKICAALVHLRPGDVQATIWGPITDMSSQIRAS